jgi:hypothetical protein
MSNFGIPTNQKPQGASRGDFQNTPGLQNLRPAPDEARISLMRAMGQGFVKLGNEMIKGIAMDPTEAAKAKAMIAQAQIAARGASAQAPAGPAPTGGPRPVDRGIDPLSGAPVGQQGQGRNTQGF